MSRWDAASRFKNWLGWFVNGSQFDKLASSGSLFMSRTLCGKLNNLVMRGPLRTIAEAVVNDFNRNVTVSSASVDVAALFNNER